MTTTRITHRQVNTNHKLSMRPQMFAGRVGGVAKPTFVTLGAYGGYSFPIYQNDDEELVFREYIPGRWNEASNITATMTVCLASAETAGEDFRMQLSWASNPGTGVIAAAVTNVETQQELAAGRAAQYDVYRLTFAIDYTVPTPDLASSDHFAGRIRRIAATGAGVDEVDGEIIMLDFVMTYFLDKIFKPI